MVPLVGASGAIAGLLGAYMAAFPQAGVLVIVLIRIVRVPAVVVLGAWFLIQILNVSMDPRGTAGGVAWYAHIAGFIAGYLVLKRRLTRVRREFMVQ